MGLCLTEMHLFGLVIPARGIVTSLISRLLSMSTRVRGTLFGRRGKRLQCRLAKWPVVEVPRLTHGKVPCQHSGQEPASPSSLTRSRIRVEIMGRSTPEGDGPAGHKARGICG